MTTPLSLGPSVRLALVADRRWGTALGEVDCRRMFLGDHYRRVVRAYREIVFLFGAWADPDRVFARLSSSAEIQQFYEVRRERDTVSVTLREPFFRTPGPIEEVEIEVKVTRGRRTFFHPLPVERLRGLGCLLPLLLRGSGEAAIEEDLDRRLGRDDRGWALELLNVLRRHGCLDHGEGRPNVFLGRGPRPRVTLMGHSSLLLQSRTAAVVVDPILRPEMGHPRRAFDVARLELAGICCSHAHWDHSDLQSLMWFDKATPVVVPRVSRHSAFNPPMVDVLQRLGFTTVREVDPWQPVSIGDVELIPLPFHGEQDEPGTEIDRYTYVLRTDGLTLYGGVDSFRDTFGDMTPVLERVRHTYRPTVAFLPVSRVVYQYRHGGVNAFCRYLDGALLEQSFQYTAGPDEAAAWATVLGARWVVPYATFRFSRRSDAPVVRDFHEALRSRGLGRCLYPLRPLEALPCPAGDAPPRSELWRRALIAWCHVAAVLQRLDGGLKDQPGYRTVRSIARRLRARWLLAT